ncbi:uncharacterized protein LOC142326454 isoform X3 [Lycorma delicatula]|uniref:uncharacterized protein LOC142326454 isoform X3 n=1 Tax=Lycorma delicatula TaxID=130591 RepID=UPI003F50FF2E
MIKISDSFISNLLRIIQHMRPNKSSSNINNDIDKTPPLMSADKLAKKFPGLAIPNDSFKSILDSKDNDNNDDENDNDKKSKGKHKIDKDKIEDNDDDGHSKKKSKKMKKLYNENDTVDDAIAALEALAPSQVMLRAENEIARTSLDRVAISVQPFLRCAA